MIDLLGPNLQVDEFEGKEWPAGEGKKPGITLVV